MTRKQLPISQIKPGPMRHDQLSLSLTARINYLQKTLDEVYPQTIEKDGILTAFWDSLL